jgi:sporulation protein YlmC with PRC-barrel domain
MATANQWRASKLIGLDVYNDQNEKLGDINEVLLDQSGKVPGVVIGVGGFLGMGQREILVTMDKLKFVNEPYRAATTTRPATTTTTATAPATTTTTTAPAATTAAGERATTTTVRAANEKWYPDHAILSGATKDSLKSMSEFKYN